MFNKNGFLCNFLLKCLTRKHCATYCRNSRSFSQISGTSQQSYEIKKCCDTLRISYDFNEIELKHAYLEGCKRTHPDLSDATNEDFASIELAYNTLKDYLKTKLETKHILEEIKCEEMEDEIPLKHKVLQHRHYLSFDGKGYGTPTERQKQYQTNRLSEATNRVNEFQLNQIKSTDELSERNAIVLRDPNLKRQIKTRQGFDRLVEDLIQESMAKGEFENLPGYGKPLHNKPEYPYLDSTTYKLNEILINNGFVPQWVLLEREIREERSQIKNKLFGLKSESKLDIVFVKQILTEKVNELNKTIDKYNRIVPILNKQQNHLNLEKEVIKLKKIDDNCGDMG